MNRRIRRAGALSALSVLVLVTGCRFTGAEDLPLPGATGSDGYRVTLTVDDAANLVPKETCRANDTVVGSVASVELDDELRARVVCRIERGVHLPANVTGQIRATSLLGEKYVALDVPEGQQPRGRLADGAVVPAGRPATSPDTEIVLGALSQVLNGGSLGGIASISRELITALDGRSDLARRGAERLSLLLTDLDGRRDSIVRTLEALGDLSTTLARQREVIARTLDDVPAGLQALDRQRPRLVAALEHLRGLSEEAIPLLQRSRRATVSDLRHLAPVLNQVAAVGDDLAPSLERLASFPFNGNTLYTIKSDYATAYVQANVDLDTVIGLLADLAAKDGGSAPPPNAAKPTAGADDAGDDEHGGGLQLPSLDDLGLGDLTDLPGLSALGDLLHLPALADKHRPLDLGDLLAGPAGRGAR